MWAGIDKMRGSELAMTPLQDGQVAETKIKLRAGDTLVIDTVAGNVQLNLLRRFLNEGFQSHLQNNELLHQVSVIFYAAFETFATAAVPPYLRPYH